MNSLERVMGAVRFEPVDRVPVIAQLIAHAGVVEGVSIWDYTRSGETVAECQLKALRRYEHDAVITAMDLNVETEACGAVLRRMEGAYAVVDRFPFAVEDDPDAVQIPDPEKAGRMPEMLKALRLLRRELNDDVPVIGFVLGPLSLVGQWLGLERALFLAMDEPDRFEHWLEKAYETLARFGLAQLEAGAHAIMVFDPASSTEVVPPAFFRELSQPRLSQLFQAFTQAGTAVNWLHIAGCSQTILPFYGEAGVQIANFDYCVSADEAIDLCGICLDGNIKPLLFSDGTAEEIGAVAETLLDRFAGRGGFILSSGCEIPPHSPSDNVRAMTEAVRRAGT
jgi:uroporphyrinogen decarboxylase